eukprot:g67898.t1
MQKAAPNYSHLAHEGVFDQTELKGALAPRLKVMWSRLVAGGTAEHADRALSLARAQSKSKQQATTTPDICKPTRQCQHVRVGRRGWSD